eukprot:COSAG03_NODE_987_length_5098_cov_24.705341_2_plen_164_part_00
MAIANPDPWDTRGTEIPNGWTVHLPPQAASKHGDTKHTIEIQCSAGCTSGNHTVTLERVLFGDVLVCAGQSNMELILGVTFSWYGQFEATDEWSGTFSQTYGSILTVILHTNDVPCCVACSGSHRNISNDTSYPIHFAHMDHNLVIPGPSDTPTVSYPPNAFS